MTSPIQVCHLLFAFKPKLFFNAFIPETQQTQREQHQKVLHNHYTSADEVKSTWWLRQHQVNMIKDMLWSP